MKTNSRIGKGAHGVPRISDAEWMVMKILWQKKTATANQVVDALAGEADWKPKTIHTLLSRLVQKQALTYEKKGREYLFKPLVNEEECRLAASHSFLEKVFDGEIAPFLACFLAHGKLTRADIAEMKELLEGRVP